MAEEKILIPAYKRSGSCARCRADIYSPDLKQHGGWPLMSACVCEHGPKIARGKKAENLLRETEVKLEEQAQAA
jgi:hypothetical protein